MQSAVAAADESITTSSRQRGISSPPTTLKFNLNGVRAVQALDPTAHDMVCVAKATNNDVTTKKPRLCEPPTTPAANPRAPHHHRPTSPNAQPTPPSNQRSARDTRHTARPAPNHAPRGAASAVGERAPQKREGHGRRGTVRGPQSAREAPWRARTAPHERCIRTRKRNRARRPSHMPCHAGKPPPHAAAAREATARRRRGACRPSPTPALPCQRGISSPPTTLNLNLNGSAPSKLNRIARDTIHKAIAAVDEIDDTTIPGSRHGVISRLRLGWVGHRRTYEVAVAAGSTPRGRVHADDTSAQQRTTASRRLPSPSVRRRGRRCWVDTNQFSLAITHHHLEPSRPRNTVRKTTAAGPSIEDDGAPPFAHALDALRHRLQALATARVRQRSDDVLGTSARVAAVWQELLTAAAAQVALATAGHESGSARRIARPPLSWPHPIRVSRSGWPACPAGRAAASVSAGGGTDSLGMYRTRSRMQRCEGWQDAAAERQRCGWAMRQRGADTSPSTDRCAAAPSSAPRDHDAEAHDDDDAADEDVDDDAADIDDIGATATDGMANNGNMDDDGGEDDGSKDDKQRGCIVEYLVTRIHMRNKNLILYILLAPWNAPYN
ncbi:hypothetical protein BJ912DRAFT_927380 [Pholiota molesta]|nr:hypothetical protein BJ912DRAFT_927380 [Pholiota molesta]